MSSKRWVRIAKGEGMATLELQDEKRLNAFSMDLASEFLSAVQELTADPGVHLVLIQGAGAIFSAGANIKEMGEATDKRKFFDELSSKIYDALFLMRESDKIFVAAVHGKVIGVALPLVLCCDLVWAKAGTEIVPGYLNIGLFPNGGLTYLLPELMGSKRALELLLVQKKISAEEALAQGVISAVIKDPFGEEVDRRICKLLGGPMAIYKRTKELVALQRAKAFRNHMKLEKVELLASSESEEFRQGLSQALRPQS